MSCVAMLVMVITQAGRGLQSLSVQTHWQTYTASCSCQSGKCPVWGYASFELEPHCLVGAGESCQCHETTFKPSVCSGGP